VHKQHCAGSPPRITVIGEAFACHAEMTTSPPPEAQDFLTTRWTRVCLAKEASDDGRRALADLCEAYYEPVVAFLRCELRDAAAARDLSHEFFAEILGGGRIEGADQSRGRFRSYLLGAVKHFAAHKREAAARLKRGGGLERATLDDDEAMAVPDAGLSPDAAFERQWALTVLGRALEALEKESVANGRAAFFEKVKPLLTDGSDHGAQAQVAEACGMNVAALRMALHRLRRRLREFVQAEVAGTLDDPALLKEEMQALFAALGG
jgi:RNA polymerase sigma factor (sigma-70 family)